MSEGQAPAAVCIGVAHAVRADSNDVRNASLWLGRVGNENGVPAEQVSRLDHCLDEMLANIIMHGGAGARATPVMLRLEVCRKASGNEAALCVSDSGIPFDPLSAQPSVRPVSLAEAEIGGLGLLMMQSNADRLSYQHEDGRNQTTFVVRWQELA